MRFEPIYGARAAEYHELVNREDVQGNLHAVLRGTVDGKAKTVVELGAGTGRVTKIVVAEAVPLPDASADIVIEGWSFSGWWAGAEALLDEPLRLLKPGGTVIIIETLGTGARVSATPGPILPLFYAWQEEEKKFCAPLDPYRPLV